MKAKDFVGKQVIVTYAGGQIHDYSKKPPIMSYYSEKIRYAYCHGVTKEGYLIVESNDSSWVSVVSKDIVKVNNA